MTYKTDIEREKKKRLYTLKTNLYFFFLTLVCIALVLFAMVR